MPEETWLPIKGYEGLYEVSNLGRVRSLTHISSRTDGRHVSTWRGRVLKLNPDSTGYLAVALCKQGTPRKFRVHRLVAEAFIAGMGPGKEVCHGNGIKTDNRAVNLRWDTSLANYLDQVKHGTAPYLGRTHCGRGHVLSETLYVSPKGKRKCRECRRVSDRERRIKSDPNYRPSQTVPYVDPDGPEAA